MAKEKTALPVAPDNAEHDPTRVVGQHQNRNYDSSTQPRLPGEWPADFDAHGFSDKELGCAEQVWAEFDELCERVPDLIDQAATIAADEIQQRGFVGVRLLGEKVRSWCLSVHSVTFGNAVIGCIGRAVAQRNAVLGEYLHVRLCALDVVPHA